MSKDERPPGSQGNRISQRTMLGLSSLVMSLLILHTILPSTTVDTTTLGLVALLIFIWILPFVKSIRLPWDTRIDLNTESLIEATREVQRVAPSTRAVTAQSIVKSGQRPQEQVWRSLLREDVNVALAGLRIEIERKLRQLGEQAELSRGRGFQNLTQLVQGLRDKNLLTNDQANAIVAVIAVCNQAVHSEKISPEAAQVAADLGDTVLQLLDTKIERPRGPKITGDEEA